MKIGRFIASGAIGLGMFSSGLSAADGSTQIGAWQVQHNKDVMSDFDRPIAIAKSENGALLVLKCDSAGDHSVYVDIISPDYLGGRGGDPAVRSFTYRIDGGDPIQSSWAYDGRNAMAFGDNPPGARDEFLKGLAGAEKVAVRMISYDGGQHDQVFNVSGSAKVIDTVFAACQDKSRYW